RPERIGFAGVMNPQKYAEAARLLQLQPFDPARTPVIFVHGLQETPVSWVPMVDSLRDDPWIRKHYQFWVYGYPSGYPYPYSSMLFRRDLDGIKRAFPNHKRVVLIGHSMGGMICRLMITDAEDKIWRDFFSTPPAKTAGAGDAQTSGRGVRVQSSDRRSTGNLYFDAASREHIRRRLHWLHRRRAGENS